MTRVVIEGAIMSVCDSCRRLGKTVVDEQLPLGREAQPKASPRRRLGGVRPSRAPDDLGKALGKNELVKGYGQVVRGAREEWA